MEIFNDKLMQLGSCVREKQGTLGTLYILPGKE